MGAADPLGQTASNTSESHLKTHNSQAAQMLKSSFHGSILIKLYCRSKGITCIYIKEEMADIYKSALEVYLQVLIHFWECHITVHNVDNH